MTIPRFLMSLSCAALGAAAALPAGALTLDPSQQKRIDAVFAAYDKPDSPGCALGVMSDGRIIYARGYGQAKLDPTPTPIDSTKLFDIASMSKQFAAASIVLLAQQGKLKLTDDIRKYLPEMPNYGTPITLNHLLWHTSGLRDYTSLLLLSSFDYPEVTTEQQAFELIARQRKLDFVPGTQHSYSNTGYVLLAIIVQRVSGVTLNQFARRLIFNPLSMPLAVFRDRHDLPIPNQALGYAEAETPGEFEVYMSNWEQVGDGGLQLNIEELQNWDENFYHPDVGGPAFVTEMYRRGKLTNGRQLTYARGLVVDRYRGLDRVSHGGDWVGYHSNFERFPSVHTSVALMCNLEGINQYDLSQAVIDIALEKVFPEPKPVEPPPSPSLPIARFVGDYYSNAVRDVYSIVQVDDGLVFKYVYLTLPMVALGPTTFTIAGVPSARIEFAVKGNDPANALTFRLDKDDPDTNPRQAVRFTPVAPGDLAPFLGRFHSTELNVTWEIKLEEGALVVDDLDETPALLINGPLQPAFADSFYGNPGFIRFTRNGSGAVNGFNMSYNTAIDFRFDLQH